MTNVADEARALVDLAERARALIDRTKHMRPIPWVAELAQSFIDLSTQLTKYRRVVVAARHGLNFIENTESELGIKLDSGNMLRDAIAELPEGPCTTT